MSAIHSFDSLNVNQKYILLKSKGVYVASRIHGSYQVHLFTLEGSYVEVWRTIGLTYIHWIERVKSNNILDSYLDDLDINLDFD